ncbi:hypothetical protein GCM10027073_13080 [Streptomyces chlorus]
MSKPTKQIHLAAHFPGVNNTTVWSDPAAGSHIDFSSFVHFARTAERAKFDFLFLAEGLRLREQGGKIYDLDVVGRPDTFTVLTALAAVTDRLGLTGTINSTFNEPYEVARQFASLDHLSGGRAAWNVVTSWDAFTGENFRRGGFLPEEERYSRAKEFLATAIELLDSWHGDEILADRATGTFLRDARAGAFVHRGQHFDIQGRFNVPRSPQGRPVIFQAGDSEEGREFADAVESAAAEPRHRGGRGSRDHRSGGRRPPHGGLGGGGFGDGGPGLAGLRLGHCGLRDGGFAQQEQCRVVVQPAAHMRQQLLVQGRDGARRFGWAGRRPAPPLAWRGPPARRHGRRGSHLPRSRGTVHHRGTRAAERNVRRTDQRHRHRHGSPHGAHSGDGGRPRRPPRPGTDRGRQQRPARRTAGRRLLRNRGPSTRRAPGWREPSPLARVRCPTRESPSTRTPGDRPTPTAPTRATPSACTSRRPPWTASRARSGCAGY